MMADPLAMEVDEPGELAPGTRLGRYELLVPVARGGMARVWAARMHGQRGFTKLVAIKTILPHLASEQEFERMFLDEARIASNVHHPNVCETYELGEENGVLYLAMEWVSGDSLSRVIRPTQGPQTYPLELRIVARILADACAGLHAAHELVGDDGTHLSVVHRDFSPHNILISAEGNVKVADFGVAKAFGQLHENTSAGQIKGKLAYMSPEQVGGIADRRSDVFSAGCVLYEATLGIAPFRADNDLQTIQGLLQGHYVRPSERAPGYPPDFEWIVMTALAAEPERRFQTAEQLRVALEEWLARTGQVVTQAQVAQAVRARIGERIDRRRDRIRSAQAASVADLRDEAMTPSGRSPRSASGVQPVIVRDALEMSRSQRFPTQADMSGSYSQVGPQGYPGYPAPAPAEDNSRYNAIGSVAIGVILAVLLVGGGFLYSSRASAPVAAPIATPAAPAKAVVAAPPADTASAAVVASVAPPADLELPDVPFLALELEPATALVAVDSAAPAAMRSIPLPAAGKSVVLTFKAEGYTDTVATVDSKTATPLKVTLKPRPKAAAPSGGSGGGPAVPPTPRPGAGPKPPAIPASPY
ncbi:MAG: serine/threonine protein kinase [Myxococcales bacterium]|nr:serine/threonine protein kinase [Myxococcales bacterium]